MAHLQQKRSSCACIFQNPRIVPASKYVSCTAHCTVDKRKHLSRWEHPIPKAKDYWQKFCDDEEKKILKVRRSIPNLPKLCPDSASHALSRETFKTSIIDNRSVESALPREPILKISPPTPLKKSLKHFSINEKVEIISDGDGISIKSHDFPKKYPSDESHSTLSMAPTQSVVDRKVYPKGKCPLHRNEPPVKIFDDKIDQYLVQVDKMPFASQVDSLKSRTKNAKSKSKQDRKKEQRSESSDARCLIKQDDVERGSVITNEIDDFKDVPSHVLLPTSDMTDQTSEIQPPRQKRIPKLKSASLLPSFARTVSESSSESYNTANIRHQISIIRGDDIAHDAPAEISYPKLLQLPDIEQSSKREVDNESSAAQDLLRVPDISSHRQKHGLVKTHETESKANGGIKEPKSEVTKESELTAIVTSKKIHYDGSREEFEESPAESTTLTDKDEKVNARRPSSKNRHSLRYSVRCAYRALKFITANKKLDFEPKCDEKLSEESSSSSGDRPRSQENAGFLDIKDNEARDKLKDEDALFHRDVQKRLRKKWKRSRDPTSAEYGDSSTATVKSIIIPTRSRSTSGTSNKFAFQETSRSRSANILNRLPPMSYPRKTHDRCLSCLCQSVVTADRRKTINVNLERTISRHGDDDERKQAAITSRESTDSYSSSITLPDLPAIILKEDFRAVVGADDYEGTIGELSAEASSRSEIKEERCGGDVEEAIKKEAASNADTTAQRAVDLSLLSKDSSVAARMATKSTSVSSEKSMHSSSPGAQSTDETESPVILAGEDSANSKRLAPCHAPTIFKPSLEHLRALRFKKTATAKQAKSEEAARLTTDTSADEDEESHARRMTDDRRRRKISETPSPREPKDERKEAQEEPRKLLTKMKSVMEKISGDTLSARDVTLRRGSSCLDLTVEVPLEASRPMSESTRAPVSTDALIEDVLRKYLFRGSTLRLVSDLPRFSIGNFVEFAKEYLVQNSNTIEALEGLCDEFLKRVLVSLGATRDSADAKRDGLVRQLVKLLIDSKRYLNPDKYPSDLLFSSKQPPLCNSRLLRRIFPLDIYNMVAPILGMPESHPTRTAPSFGRSVDIDTKYDYSADNDKEPEDDSADDLVVHPPTTRDESLVGHDKSSHQRLNPYALFLKKPRRKAITWRPLTEKDLEGYNPNATLSMRAKNVTDKICREFCEWLRSLGGIDELIDEEGLGDMFEIDFSAEAVRAMQVSYKEMPTVPDDVALARRCPETTELAMTRKELIKDAKAERRPRKTVAFGTTMPRKLRFVPPNNHVRETWLKCENVPQDLETMEAVWKGITHLESVKGFTLSLEDHPKIPVPEILKSVTLADAMRPAEDDTFAHLELEMTQIGSLKVEDT